MMNPSFKTRPQPIHRALVRPMMLVGLLALGFLGLFASGCDVLDVDNPNNLREEELDNPAAATPMANGSEAAATRALNTVLSSMATASDELTWIGSRDAWGQLDRGNIDDPVNEFTDAAFPYMGEARWTTDEYIRRLQAFREEGALSSVRPLVRTYLYGAVLYATIPDIYDDFVVTSDGLEAGTAVGPSNMNSLYTTALDYVDEGLTLAAEDADANADLVDALTVMRARILYAQALWGKLNPVDTASPLVGASEVDAAAAAALERIDETYAFNLDLAGIPDLVDGAVSMAFQVNDRAELGFGETYVATNDDGTFSEVTFPDILSGEVDPVLRSSINAFVADGQFADVPVVTGAEMRLIRAEAALASGDLDAFAEQINALRGTAARPAWAPDSGVSALDMLLHERRVQLFLQGRRLADHYRFDQPSPEWDTATFDGPGTFLPIAISEIRANPNLTAP
jgi:hypothetical protein